jgi:ribose transport system substrate-binding protein
MINKCILRVLVLALMLTSVTACVRNSPSTNPQSIEIALIPMGTTDEYWRTIHAGAERAARELGVKVIWQGPMRRDDRSAQCDVVDNMIVRKVSGIVLAPVDSMALRGPVEDAYRSGIPIVVIDSDLRSNRLLSFIATNNYKGGLMAGEHLSQLLSGKGRIVMLRGVEGNASTDNRERGFIDAIKMHREIVVVSSNQHGGGTSETAYKASENLLAPLKNGQGKLSIDGIFCPNESTTFGMLRALQDGGLAGKIAFIGFDSSEKLNRALARKEISALVVQNPMKIGYLGIKTLVAHLHHEPVVAKVDVAAALITSENMNETAMHELLYPDLSRWLK